MLFLKNTLVPKKQLYIIKDGDGYDTFRVIRRITNRQINKTPYLFKWKWHRELEAHTKRIKRMGWLKEIREQEKK